MLRVLLNVVGYALGATVLTIGVFDIRRRFREQHRGERHIFWKAVTHKTDPTHPEDKDWREIEPDSDAP